MNAIAQLLETCVLAAVTTAPAIPTSHPGEADVSPKAKAPVVYFLEDAETGRCRVQSDQIAASGVEVQTIATIPEACDAVELSAISGSTLGIAVRRGSSSFYLERCERAKAAWTCRREPAPPRMEIDRVGTIEGRMAVLGFTDLAASEEESETDDLDNSQGYAYVLDGRWRLVEKARLFCEATDAACTAAMSSARKLVGTMWKDRFQSPPNGKEVGTRSLARRLNAAVGRHVTGAVWVRLDIEGPPVYYRIDGDEPKWYPTGEVVMQCAGARLERPAEWPFSTETTMMVQQVGDTVLFSDEDAAALFVRAGRGWKLLWKCAGCHFSVVARPGRA